MVFWLFYFGHCNFTIVKKINCFFHARKRENGKLKTQYLRDLIYCISTLEICLLAGLSLQQAFASIQINTLNAELRDQIQAVHETVMRGYSFREALKHHAFQISYFGELIASLENTHKMGTPVSFVLQEFNRYLLSVFHERIDSHMAQIPVKMLMPIGLFLMPVLLVLLCIGPIRNIVKGVFI